MKFVSAFRAFLKDTVDLNSTRLNQLESRVVSIMDYLKSDDAVGPMVLTCIPQGSWPQKTIIRPIGEYDEFDADFLLQLKLNPDWAGQPREYLRHLRAALKRSTTYGEKVRKKNRCVRITYANDCHIDIVPHLVLDDGRQVIVNYSANSFEGTNPLGFTGWMKEKDAATGGHLRRVIRLVKYIRDSKNTFSCPSIILTTLLGSVVRSDGDYGDFPTALLTMLRDLDFHLSATPSMPYIEDPSCPGTTFNHRWSEEKYENFRSKLTLYTSKVDQAYQESDREKSLALWQGILGSKFQLPDGKSVASSFSGDGTALTEARAPQEEFLEEKGYQYIGGYEALIECIVQRKEGFRHGCLRTMGRVNKNRWLDFRVSSNVPRPFQVFWKVRNRGKEAAEVGQLRGELSLDSGQGSRSERTAYAGEHYVEAYIVKDGLVLARARHEVVVA